MVTLVLPDPERGAPMMIADALASLSPAPKLALIFGSLARGTENPGSDIDLLVIGGASFGAVVKTLHPTQLALQREINPVIYSAAEFKRRVAARDGFVANILANPTLFVIGTANDLAKLAGQPSVATV